MNGRNKTQKFMYKKESPTEIKEEEKVKMKKKKD